MPTQPLQWQSWLLINEVLVDNILKLQCWLMCGDEVTGMGTVRMNIKTLDHALPPFFSFSLCFASKVSNMPRHPLSTAQRTQQTAAKKEAHILSVVSSYFTQLKNAKDQGHKPASPYSFAIDSDIPYSTLVRCIQGGEGQGSAAAHRSWLSQMENDTLVDFLLNMADHAFPACWDHVKEYTLEVIQIENLDIKKLGKNWVDRFLNKNRDWLQTKYGSNLENVRGAAVNPSTITHWFELLQAQFKHFNFEAGNIYAMDESGFPFGTGQKVKVVVQKGTKSAHLQCDGNQENVSVICIICTVCADGLSIPPIVIFKGKKVLPEWLENNPLQAA